MIVPVELQNSKHFENRSPADTVAAQGRDANRFRGAGEGVRRGGWLESGE